MDPAYVALAAMTVVSAGVAIWSGVRAAKAEERAASAERIVSRPIERDQVHILPNGQVRVAGMRGDHLHVVILGKPDKGKRRHRGG